MLTVEDIAKLTQVFATKQDLKDLEGRLVSKAEFNEKFELFMEKIDSVYGEVKTMREEQVAH